MEGLPYVRSVRKVYYIICEVSEEGLVVEHSVSTKLMITVQCNQPTD